MRWGRWYKKRQALTKQLKHFQVQGGYIWKSQHLKAMDIGDVRKI
jgi:hypothetical protein